MIKNPITMGQAAKIAGMEYGAFYKWIVQGRGPSYEKFNESYQFDADEVKAWNPKKRKTGIVKGSKEKYNNPLTS